MTGEPAISKWKRAADLHDRGRPKAAIGVLEAIVRREREPALLQVLGNWRAEVGDLAGAESAYAQALDLDPTFARALVGLGLLRSDSGDLADAEMKFRAALDLDENGLTHNHLGVVLAHLGRDREATEHLARSVELGGTGGEAELNLALSIEHAEPDKAIELLKRAIGLGEDRAEAHLARLLS